MLEPYRRIACFIDQDVASEAAVAEARRLRESCRADLDLVHVAPEPLALSTGPYAYLAVSEDYMADAREWIESRAREEGATPVLLSGPAARAACRYARDAEVELIVAAAYRGLVRRAVLGSFAAYVAYRAPCPVLLVRPPEADDEDDDGPGAA